MQIDEHRGVRGMWLRLREEASHVMVGLDGAFEELTIAVLSGGHVLLEGVPGTGKTLLAKTLAALIGAEFRRIQFTPDLMPSDIVGTNVFDLSTNLFHVRKGPIFSAVVLADEINRAPAKTQAALLEAMEEGQVTIEGDTYSLGDPYFVVATQNPVEYEGTYPLPEAQLDRFQFKVLVDYRSAEEETEVLRRHNRSGNAHRVVEDLTPIVTAAEIAALKQEAEKVKVEDGLLEYMTAIAQASRRFPDLALGASPRASLAVLRGARVKALIEGRDFVLPDDIKQLVPPAYRHRILLKPEAEIQGVTPDDVIGRILASVEVPR